jgi:outer membrane protein
MKQVPSYFSTMRSLILVFFTILFHFSAKAQWTLEKCVEQAIGNNIQLQQAIINEQITSYGQWTAVGSMLPNVNGQASHGYNWGQRIDPFTNSFASERIQSNSFGVSSSIDLFTGGQNWFNYQKAKSDAAASQWNVENVKNQIALQTANAFLNVMLTTELLKIAQSTSDNSMEQLNRLKKLYEIGTINPGTLSEMEAQYKSDLANQVVSENNLKVAKLALIQIMRLGEKESQVFEASFPDIALFGVSDQLPPKSLVIETALGIQPSIQSSLAAISAAQFNYKMAKSGVSPRLSASLSLGTGYSGAARVITGNPDLLSYPIGTVMGTNDIVLSIPQQVYFSDDYAVKSFDAQMRDNVNRSFFFSLTVPIFNGFQNHANIQRSRLGVENAKLNWELAKQQLKMDIETAYTNAEAAISSYRANELSFQSNEQSYQWSKTRYDNGLINATELSIARNRMDIAKAQLVRSKVDFVFKRNILNFYLNQPIQLQP